jgi:ribosomal protein L16 Arg81 hydroxylase
MSAKQIDVKCPCCSSVLTVDVLTGKIMRTVRADERADAGSVDRWDAANERVRERTTKSADKLESALQDERTKEARFDEIFKQAQAKHSRKPDADE